MLKKLIVEEVAVAYFKVHSQHLPAGNDGNHEISPSMFYGRDSNLALYPVKFSSVTV